MRLVIVGRDGGTNVAGSLLRGAATLGHAARLVDTRGASSSISVINKLWWHLLERRSPRMRAFGDEVVRAAGREVRLVLVTGTAPLSVAALRRLRAAGIKTLNFLTDDPWNVGMGSDWFRSTLREYDLLVTPRHANVADLGRAGARRVEYLPFGYDDALFHTETAASPRVAKSVLFVGGADGDRIDLLRDALAAGVPLALCGDYWGKDATLAPHWIGRAEPAELCRLTAGAAVNLCLVRRANRDGHVMRSFEIPAVGGCMLVERTDEHAAIFGAEGEAVLYFDGAAELAAKARRLLDDPGERRRLADVAHRRITSGGNTYRDRLRTMLAMAEGAQ
jgi:hypothetical protein